MLNSRCFKSDHVDYRRREDRSADSISGYFDCSKNGC